MRKFATSVLVTRCSRRANKQNDTSFAPTDVKTLISEVWGQLYGAVADTGMRMVENTSLITSTGAQSYTMPTDHRNTIAVDYLVDGTTSGRRYPLDEFMPQERAAWAGLTGNARVYAPIDQQLWLLPTPPSGQKFEMAYIPQAPDISANADATQIDVYSEAGERFLIWGVAVLMHGEGETDAQLAIRERDAALEATIEAAALRAFHEPRRSVVSFGDYWPYREGDYR